MRLGCTCQEVGSRRDEVKFNCWNTGAEDTGLERPVRHVVDHHCRSDLPILSGAVVEVFSFRFQVVACNSYTPAGSLEYRRGGVVHHL